jgi:hypothetical protein
MVSGITYQLNIMEGGMKQMMQEHGNLTIMHCPKENMRGVGQCEGDEVLTQSLPEP